MIASLGYYYLYYYYVPNVVVDVMDSVLEFFSL